MDIQTDCCYCGKPCGPPSKGLEGAKVSHFACAYDAAKEPRERLLSVLSKPIASAPSSSLPTRVSE